MDSCSFPAALMYFYPRPPRGGRHPAAVKSNDNVRFLSTPSARRATTTTVQNATNVFVFLSTPSARRATLLEKGVQHSVHISIHALREEGDRVHRRHRQHRRISIHALREEGDAIKQLGFSYDFKFLSTPSARRATQDRQSQRGFAEDFYPRPPRGGRRMVEFGAMATIKFLSTPSARRATRAGPFLRFVNHISIHALREEGDQR